MNDKLRPVLKNLINSNTSDLERFQNEVIRPIIKTIANNIGWISFSEIYKKLSELRLLHITNENKIQ